MDLIGHGLFEYGSDERLTRTRDKVATAKAEWERAEEIRGLVEKSSQLVAQNNFENASELLGSALRRFPNEPELSRALASTQAALKARLREEGIVRTCSQAQAQLDERQFRSALESIDLASAEYGPDRRLSELRDRISLAKAEWDRAEAVRRIVDEARSLVARQDFNEAIAVPSSLKSYSNEAQLVEALRSARNALEAKRRDDAIRPALCAQARAQLEKLDFANALNAVNRGLEDYGSDPRLTATREAVLAAKAEWDRAEAIRRAVELSQQHVHQRQPERALESLEPVLAQYADEPKLLEAKALAQEALAAKQREQAIEALGRQAQTQLEAGAYQDAIELLDRGLQHYGEDRRLKDLRTTVLEAKAAWERAAAIGRILDDSQKLIAQKEFEKAIALLEAALDEYSGEAELRARCRQRARS